MSAAVAIPGKVGDPRVPRRQRERVGQAGRHDEAAAGIERLGKLRLVEHRPGADDRAGHLAHPADRFQRLGRAKRDLEHRKPGGHERLREPGPVVLAIEHEHRDDRRGPHDFVDGHRCSFANAAAAP